MAWTISSGLTAGSGSVLVPVRLDRRASRMHVQLTSIDLLAGDLGPWQ
jgi:hypothetical protein